ncbi:MAG: dockerin type I repeat-containing protein, partial [Muribaculaceae bacterium]|nr:dockerin type I repeat-containing protein [Muribaculaceae bacterium]
SADVWKTFELKVPFEAGKQRIRVLSGQSTTCKVNWFEIVDNSHVYGDINGDKVVDVKDLTALINMVLGVIPTDLTVADLNDDGDVNVQDVTRLIAIIIGD